MILTLPEYERVFKANHKTLCNTAYRITRDIDSAKDIVQNVFLKLWDKRHELKIESTLEGYLYKATANASLNFIEAKKLQMRFTEEIKASFIPSQDNASESVRIKELETLIERTLLSLPPKCRAIFILNRYEGLRYKQIAEQLDISVNTVENQMAKALSLMREGLKPYLTKEFLIISISGGLVALLHLLS